MRFIFHFYFASFLLSFSPSRKTLIVKAAFYSFSFPAPLPEQSSSGRKGEELGTIIYSLNGKELGRVSLVAKEDIKRAVYIDYLKQILQLLT